MVKYQGSKSITRRMCDCYYHSHIPLYLALYFTKLITAPSPGTLSIHKSHAQWLLWPNYSLELLYFSDTKVRIFPNTVISPLFLLPNPLASHFFLHGIVFIILSTTEKSPNYWLNQQSQKSSQLHQSAFYLFTLKYPYTTKSVFTFFFFTKQRKYCFPVLFHLNSHVIQFLEKIKLSTGCFRASVSYILPLSDCIRFLVLSLP